MLYFSWQQGTLVEAYTKAPYSCFTSHYSDWMLYFSPNLCRGAEEQVSEGELSTIINECRRVYMWHTLLFWRTLMSPAAIILLLAATQGRYLLVM